MGFAGVAPTEPLGEPRGRREWELATKPLDRFDQFLFGIWARLIEQLPRLSRELRGRDRGRSAILLVFRQSSTRPLWLGL